MRFGSFHNHTPDSLLDATIRAETLIQQAVDFNYSAVAITEHGNMFSYLNAYKIAKEKGIKFIPGVESYETTDMDYKEKDSDRFHLILLAKSNKGLQNLFKIVTESNVRGFYGKPRIDIKTLANYSEDIIAMSACLRGRLAKLLYRGWCNCCEGSCENFEPDWEMLKMGRKI
jgi:DNA polymerase-3 subunit alpha